MCLEIFYLKLSVIASNVDLTESIYFYHEFHNKVEPSSGFEVLNGNAGPPLMAFGIEKVAPKTVNMLDRWSGKFMDHLKSAGHSVNQGSCSNTLADGLSLGSSCISLLINSRSLFVIS